MYCVHIHKDFCMNIIAENAVQIAIAIVFLLSGIDGPTESDLLPTAVAS